MDEAFDHIERFGSGHSEAIVTEDEESRERFLSTVDAAAVSAAALDKVIEGIHWWPDHLSAQYNDEPVALLLYGPDRFDIPSRAEPAELTKATDEAHAVAVERTPARSIGAPVPAEGKP